MRQAQRIRGKARAADRTRTPVICQLKKSMITHKRQGKTRQADTSKRYMPKKTSMLLMSSMRTPETIPESVFLKRARESLRK